MSNMQMYSAHNCRGIPFRNQKIKFSCLFLFIHREMFAFMNYPLKGLLKNGLSAFGLLLKTFNILIKL